MLQMWTTVHRTQNTTRSHQEQEVPQLNTEKEEKRDTKESMEVIRKHIIVRDQTLPQVSEFKYLGRILTSDNNDWVTMRRNLSKAIIRWGKVRRILCRDGATQK